MVRTVLFSVSLLLLLALAFAAFQPTGFASAATTSGLAARAASTATNQEQCTAATLKGRYLFAHSGTILPPAFGVKGPTPGADAGFHIFNGDGTGTDIVTVRVGTQIALENTAFPITYTVNADCTGHYSVPNGPSFDLYIGPKGDSIAFISTAPPGNYVSGIDPRVSSK
jgi:hypothetical protein